MPSISLKARALRYLAAREHSRLELGRKLARYAQESDDVEALLNTLETAGLLSQARFSESLINRRIKRVGNHRILSELHSHGIGKEELDRIQAELNDNEVVRACEVWRKKFDRQPGQSGRSVSAEERAKQIRFLQQRGFSHHAIQAALRAAGKEELTEED